MKLMLLLCLLPVVLCAPEPAKRSFLDTLKGFGASILDLDNLKCEIQLMLDLLGSDPSEQACEAEVHKLISDGNVFSFGAPLLCHGFQNLAHVWHIVPDTTDPTVMNRCVAGGQAVGK